MRSWHSSIWRTRPDRGVLPLDAQLAEPGGGLVVVMVQLPFIGVSARRLVSPQIAHDSGWSARKPPLNCTNSGARYWD
jgi:hypothetical protein